MQAVTANPAFSKVDQLAVRRSVLKLKNKLKRERAKNRIHTVSERRNFVPVVCEDDQEEEFKKQKNRISAQLSRDRKKEKVKSLEELNRQLLEECQRHKKENEMLKRQVKENKNTSVSPFGRMLIFLGVFFLFTTVKDTLSPLESNMAITKLQEGTSGFLAQ